MVFPWQLEKKQLKDYLPMGQNNRRLLNGWGELREGLARANEEEQTE